MICSDSTYCVYYFAPLRLACRRLALATILRSIDHGMVLRSGFNFSLGLLGFDANDAVVREKNTKYWSSGAGQQMREAVHGPS